MASDFDDHCWKDVMSPDDLKIYQQYERRTFVGPSPVLLAIDLYELVYQGGARPPADLVDTYPMSCGEYAWAAIEPTRRLFAAARAAGLPVFYSTNDARPTSRPGTVRATRRRTNPADLEHYAIRPELQPAPSRVLTTKQRASIWS